MRYYTQINNLKAIEWGLSIQQAYLFAWFYELPSWADKKIVGDKVYYFASKSKILDDLPLITDKIDTIYRYCKQLEDCGLIVIKKFKNKDYAILTEKSKEWNYSSSENNPNKLGKLSELNSDLNPTYYNINIDNNINNNLFSSFEVSSENSSANLDSEENATHPQEKQHENNYLLPCTPEIVFAKWNELADLVSIISSITKLTSVRRKKLLCRISEFPTIKEWDCIIENIYNSDFLKGVNNRNWTIDFDWLIKNDNNIQMVFEGKYNKGDKVALNGLSKKLDMSEEEKMKRDFNYIPPQA